MPHLGIQLDLLYWLICKLTSFQWALTNRLHQNLPSKLWHAYCNIVVPASVSIPLVYKSLDYKFIPLKWGCYPRPLLTKAQVSKSLAFFVAADVSSIECSQIKSYKPVSNVM